MVSADWWPHAGQVMVEVSSVMRSLPNACGETGEARSLGDVVDGCLGVVEHDSCRLALEVDLHVLDARYPPHRGAHRNGACGAGHVLDLQAHGLLRAKSRGSNQERCHDDC